MSLPTPPSPVEQPDDAVTIALRQARLPVSAQQCEQIRQGWTLLQPLLARLRADAAGLDKEEMGR